MEELLRSITMYFWVWIPIIAIVAWAFTEWLKVKEKTSRLGTSTGELEGLVAGMREEREDLVRRIQNLEAIVTHEAWDKAALPEGSRIDDRLLKSAEPTDTERAASLAKRLRSS